MQCLSSVHSSGGSEARTGWDEQEKNTLPGPADITKNMSAVHRAVGVAEGRGTFEVSRAGLSFTKKTFIKII